MYQIRNGVFETNSSSAHSLCICTEEDFEKFKDNKALWDKFEDRIVPINKIPPQYVSRAKKYYQTIQDYFMKDWDELSEENQNEFIVKEFDLSESGDLLFEDKIFFDSWGVGLETFTEHFTTPSGDRMVVFGEYGYDA